METAISEQVAEMMLDEHRNSIVVSIFVPCEQPVLAVTEPPMGRGTGTSKTVVKDASLWRSTRQKAQPCSVPISKRATQHLMKAFRMVGPTEPIGD